MSKDIKTEDLPTVWAYFREDGMAEIKDVTEIDFRANIVVISSKEDGIHVLPVAALQHLHVDGEVEMKERR